MSDFALVTGTSRGLGEALAHVLLERGWTVHGVARRSAPAALMAQADYVHHQLDLGHPKDAARWFADRLAPSAGAPTRFALVNNAGRLGPVVGLVDADAGELSETFALNAVTPTWLMGAVARAFPRAALRVVNVSSGAATSAYPGWGAYCATKAALRMAGEVFAVEVDELPALAGRDVRVVDYAPGVLETEMQAEIRRADPRGFPRRARFEELEATGELVDPALPAREIAELIEASAAERFAVLRYPAR